MARRTTTTTTTTKPEAKTNTGTKPAGSTTTTEPKTKAKPKPKPRRPPKPTHCSYDFEIEDWEVNYAISVGDDVRFSRGPYSEHLRLELVARMFAAANPALDDPGFAALLSYTHAKAGDFGIPKERLPGLRWHIFIDQTLGKPNPSHGASHFVTAVVSYHPAFAGTMRHPLE